MLNGDDGYAYEIMFNDGINIIKYKLLVVFCCNLIVVENTLTLSLFISRLAF